MSLIDGSGIVRSGEELDLARLDPWLFVHYLHWRSRRAIEHRR